MKPLQSGEHVIVTDLGGQVMLLRKIDYVVTEAKDRIVVAGGGVHWLFFCRPDDLFRDKYGKHPKFTELVVDLVGRGYFTEQRLADYRRCGSIEALDDALAIHAAKLLAGE